MVSLIEQLKEDLKAKSYSVAVITPYKAQVKRLKQALKPVIQARQNQGSVYDAKSDKYGHQSRGYKSEQLQKEEVKTSIKGNGQEEGEEDEEAVEPQPFDCEVNSIDGFQVHFPLILTQTLALVYPYYHLHK